MGKIVVIGAGLSGLSAGYHARLHHLDYMIYEQESRVGGLCRTVKKDGFLFDFSGHLLHLKKPYFVKLIRNLLGGNLTSHRRNSYIYSHGVFTPYPFQANLHGLPPKVIKECLLEFAKAYYENEDQPSSAYKSFYDWIIVKLGKGIGKHFMLPYNTKVWTVSPKKLTCEWLSEYIPRPSLEDVFNGAFAEQEKEFGYNASFYYPRMNGIQALSDAFAERTPNLRLNEKLIRVYPGDKVVEFESGLKVEYEKLISTMPLKKIVIKLRGRVPSEVIRAAENLKHTSLLILNLGVKGKALTDKHWVYIPEKKYIAYRVGCYSNFSNSMARAGTTSYYVEIGYQKDWSIQKREMINRAIQDMCEMRLICREEDILVKNVQDVECAYVIFDKNCSDNRRLVLNYLRENDIFSIGRYGNWEYSGIEEAMAQGKKVIERIACQ